MTDTLARSSPAPLDEPPRAAQPFWQRHQGLLILLPAVTLFGVLFVGPVVALLVNSVTETTGPRIVGPLTVRHYWEFISDPFYWGIFLRSLFIATMVSTGTLLIGFPLAWYSVSRGGRGLRTILMCLLAPLLAGGVVLSVGWLGLMVRGGIIMRFVDFLVPGSQAAVLLHTQAGVIIGMTHFLLPFMVLSLIAALERLPWNAIRAAASLGASPFRSFLHIVLPLSAPGAAAGFTIVFALAMSAFAVPYFLGGPRLLILSTLSYQQTARLGNYSFAAALALILVAVSTLVALAAAMAARRANRTAVEGRRGLIQ